MTGKELADFKITAHHKYKVQHKGYGGITLLYVLEGKIDVTSDELCVGLNAGELLLVNRNVGFQIDSETYNIVLTLEISNHYFAHYYKNYFYQRFILGEQNIPDFKKKYVDNIKLLLAKIMVSYIKERGESLLEINRLLSDILLTLVTFFHEPETKLSRTDMTYSQRIKKTIVFLEENYNQRVSLQQVADNEHVSFSYLSRLFKKEVGIGFTQYLNKIKFEHAVYDLLNTEKPIYRIIEDNGFADTKQFIHLFKKYYQTTPSQFRAKYRHDPQHILIKNRDRQTTTVVQKEEMVNIADLLPLLANIINNRAGKELVLDEYTYQDEKKIDLSSKPLSENVPYLPYIVFIGELCELLKENVRQQLLLLKQSAHIDYVEASHLISGNTILPEFATDEPVPTYSPFHNSDMVITFLKQNDISLFARIYHVSVLVDPASYIEKAIKFIHHCINLYGMTYMQSWHFIYYAERDEIESTDCAVFIKHYHLIRQAIRSCLPNAKVGIFCPCITDEGKILFFDSTDILANVDFLGYTASFHNNMDLGQLGNKKFQDEATYIQKKTKRVKLHLKQLGLQMPLFLMKWNTLTGNTRHTNGSYFRGALIFHTLLDLANQVNGIGIALNTEIQQETQPDFIDTTSIALFYLFKMPRPIFYVLSFMNKLQGKIVAHSYDYLVTKSENGYQLVLTNIAVFNPHLSVQEHLTQSFQKRKLLTLTGIESGTYQIKKYIFDQQHGALYEQYSHFQTKYGHDNEVIGYLENNTKPDLTVYDKNILGDSWTVLADLDINAIHFYELKRVVG